MEAPAVVDKILRDVGNVNDTVVVQQAVTTKPSMANIGLTAAVYWHDGLVSEIVHYYDKKGFENNGHRPNCGKEIISFINHAEYKWRVTSQTVISRADEKRARHKKATSIDKSFELLGGVLCNGDSKDLWALLHLWM